MNIELSNRVKSIKPSPTLAITAQAQALKASGKAIIGLGAGEPDFNSPTHVNSAAIQAIHDGFTKYTAVDGTPELKQAIINKFQQDNGLSYQSDQILVSCGGKQSFFNLALALLNRGDEVIIPAPYWVSYPDMVRLGEGEPVIIETGIKQGFKITPQQLEQAITPNTRLFVINSPSNPTGAAYSRAELAALGEVLRQHEEIIIATDDMYEKIIWSSEGFCNILNACPDLYERTVVLNGVSKAYAMTGWRIGYAGGPTTLIKAMKKIQSQSTSNPTSIAQVAAQAALEGDQHCVATMLKEFKLRHDYVVAELNTIPGVECAESQGTFYAFPSFHAVIDAHDQFNDDLGLTEFLLNRAEVALIPGSAFGAPGYMRLSYATSMEQLKLALTRIKGILS